jgi:hypothetical protein
LAVLEYHLSDGYSTTDGNGRWGYYCPGGGYIPNARFDGGDSVVGASSVAWALNQYKIKYNAALIYPSACTLSIFVDFDSTSRFLKVKSRVTKIDAFSNARLRYAIAQNKLTSTWSHVVRKMLPSYSGVVIPDTLSIGATFADSQSYTLLASWTPRNCNVVVFVQKDNSVLPKPVLRSTESGLFPTWVSGDANKDSIVGISDVIYLQNYLFLGTAAPKPLASGDPNYDCNVDIGDVIYLINYLFLNGPAPSKGCAW